MGLQNSKDCCLFLPLVASSQKGEARCQSELSCMRCFLGYKGVREPLAESVCSLTELKCCAGSSIAPFRAAGQGHLSLKKWNSQLPLFPGALSWEGGALLSS